MKYFFILIFCTSLLHAEEELQQQENQAIPPELIEASARSITQELQRIFSEVSETIKASDKTEEEKQDALNILKEELMLNDDFAGQIGEQIESLVDEINGELGQYMIGAIGFSVGGEVSPISLPFFKKIGNVAPGYDTSYGYLLGFFRQKNERGLSIRSSPFLTQGPSLSFDRGKMWRSKGHFYVSIKIFLSHKINSPFDLRNFNDLDQWYWGLDSKALSKIPLLNRLSVNYPGRNMQFFGHWKLDSDVEKPNLSTLEDGTFSEKISEVKDSLGYFGRFAAAEAMPDILMISWEPYGSDSSSRTIRKSLSQRLGQAELSIIKNHADRAGEGKVIYEY